MLPVGKVLAFAAQGERRCLGVRRAGRRLVCPYGAVLDGASARDQCARCAQLDRSRSVAADTMADDPRPYGVYLAYFGPGLLKVGITAVERGPARLVEQGAVAYAWLGRGPLMAARRAEALLGSALAVPDRFAKAAKRAARGVLPPVPDRVAELEQLHCAAQELVGWPETLQPVAFACADHTELFGLDRIPGDVAELGGMTSGAEIVGEVLTGVGSDVYLRLATGGEAEGAEGEGVGEREEAEEGEGVGGAGSGRAGGVGAVGLAGRAGGAGRVGGGVAVMDARMLSGWVLGAAVGRVTTVPVRAGGPGAGEREGEGRGGEGAAGRVVLRGWFGPGGSVRGGSVGVGRFRMGRFRWVAGEGRWGIRGVRGAGGFGLVAG
ncbi:DUF2797 domain-containing protein [Streptomyces hygroscopicus]|uniref:DUF2797 domain-containing protein n=1 Tax=Streptomyces hygroscopicus TaxID=1912 RepID=UPI00204B0795|nr:DUF2797 domain-containing protein [Streptomyces hygroscopicus]BDH16171.1 hypothetical protein HOK021_73500 [Streptomyces hygroscopicus]